MDDMQKEISELKEFIAALKTDREEHKEKERREAWTKYVSLTVVVVAVFAAIASQWSGKYSGRALTELNKATLKQAQASDQWAYYQAKSIKQNLCEIARDQMSKDGSDTALIEKLNGKIAKYEKEKEEVDHSARAFENERKEASNAADAASARGGGMGLAISLFSVSIATASICMVTKKKPLWFVSMALAAVAIAEVIKIQIS